MSTSCLFRFYILETERLQHIAGAHSSQDPSYAQKPTYSSMFAKHIWFRVLLIGSPANSTLPSTDPSIPDLFIRFFSDSGLISCFGSVFFFDKNSRDTFCPFSVFPIPKSSASAGLLGQYRSKAPFPCVLIDAALHLCFFFRQGVVFFRCVCVFVLCHLDAI